MQLHMQPCHPCMSTSCMHTLSTVCLGTECGRGPGSILRTASSFFGRTCPGRPEASRTGGERHIEAPHGDLLLSRLHDEGVDLPALQIAHFPNLKRKPIGLTGGGIFGRLLGVNVMATE